MQRGSLIHAETLHPAAHAATCMQQVSRSQPDWCNYPSLQLGCGAEGIVLQGFSVQLVRRGNMRIRKIRQFPPHQKGRLWRESQEKCGGGERIQCGNTGERRMTQREKIVLWIWVGEQTERKRNVGRSCGFSGSSFVILIFVLFCFLQEYMLNAENLET